MTVADCLDEHRPSQQRMRHGIQYDGPPRTCGSRTTLSFARDALPFHLRQGGSWPPETNLGLEQEEAGWLSIQASP